MPALGACRPRELVSTPREGSRVAQAGIQPVAAVEHNRRILICDDEARLAELTAGLLRHFGFVAEAVADGERAIAIASGEPGFDLLILDLTLPGVSSAEVIRRIRGRRTRVVLTSGYSREDVPPALLREPNVVAYLAKPYPVERLVETVREALAD
ncbi:MAG: hypothetical protein AMXMBFR56_58550 [Polyangiaceae bacterium]